MKELFCFCLFVFFFHIFFPTVPFLSRILLPPPFYFEGGHSAPYSSPIGYTTIPSPLFSSSFLHLSCFTSIFTKLLPPPSLKNIFATFMLWAYFQYSKFLCRDWKTSLRRAPWVYLFFWIILLAYSLKHISSSSCELNIPCRLSNFSQEHHVFGYLKNLNFLCLFEALLQETHCPKGLRQNYLVWNKSNLKSNFNINSRWQELI